MLVRWNSCSCERPLTDALSDLRLRHNFFVLGLSDLGFRRPQLRLELDRVHAREDLARLDHVSLFGENDGNPARELGRDLDLLRFEAAIGLRDVRGQRIQLLLPPVPGARAAERHDASQRPAATLAAFAFLRVSAQPEPRAPCCLPRDCGLRLRLTEDLVSAVDMTVSPAPSRPSRLLPEPGSLGRRYGPRCVVALIQVKSFRLDNAGDGDSDLCAMRRMTPSARATIQPSYRACTLPDVLVEVGCPREASAPSLIPRVQRSQ